MSKSPTDNPDGIRDTRWLWIHWAGALAALGIFTGFICSGFYPAWFQIAGFTVVAALGLSFTIRAAKADAKYSR